MDARSVESYFDPGGLMEPYGENGILFTCEYAILSYLSGVNETLLLERAIKSVQIDENTFKVGTDRFSHDNQTGVVAASKILNLSYHKKYFYTDWWWRAHPRDIIFYLACLNPIMRILTLPLMPILSLILIIGCQPWFGRYKENNGVRFIKTDGLILTWLRLQALTMPITEFICTTLIRNDPVFGGWRGVFAYYFADKQHPNRNFPADIYEL